MSREGRGSNPRAPQSGSASALTADGGMLRRNHLCDEVAETVLRRIGAHPQRLVGPAGGWLLVVAQLGQSARFGSGMPQVRILPTRPF